MPLDDPAVALIRLEERMPPSHTSAPSAEALYTKTG